MHRSLENRTRQFRRAGLDAFPFALLPLLAACAAKSSSEAKEPQAAEIQSITISEAEHPPWSTPYDVRPEIRDKKRAQRMVLRHYPSNLREAGVGGHAIYWLYVDEEGRVQDIRLRRSSGNPQIDAAAVKALKEISARIGYEPARRDGRPVPAWVDQEVYFFTR